MNSRDSWLRAPCSNYESVNSVKNQIVRKLASDLCTNIARFFSSVGWRCHDGSCEVCFLLSSCFTFDCVIDLFFCIFFFVLVVLGCLWRFE
jgi:hypothetical protein